MNARCEQRNRKPPTSGLAVTTRVGLLWAAGLAALAGGLGCSASTALPTSFGVNLTIQIDAAVRSQVRTVAVHVTGAEQFDKVVDITAFSGNEARIHYVPGVQNGVLTFGADGLDANQAVVAHGSSGQITLVPNQAVSAVVAISGAGSDGGVDKGPVSSCRLGQDCASGACADGVCCDRACTAGCESCALPGKVGTCSPVPAGMDPKGICPAGAAENAICTPGGCDGSGGTACRKAAVTTPCRAGSCVAGTAVNPAACQTNGICPPITQAVCGVYTCGPSSCNTMCANDMDCVMGYYCASNNTCQAKKAPGLGCVAGNECQMGLTCLDSVCCMTASCPTCRNCGSGGMCSLVVGSTAGSSDATGTACTGSQQCNAAGACLGVNGQACGAGGNCVSGNCVDGVCCSVASCGTCRNCGATGTCSVLVTNTDDISGAVCTADNTCDPTSTCKARWSLVGRVATVEQPDGIFTTGVGNFLYFANPNNSGGGAQFFKSFNVTTSIFANESTTSNPLCACGYEGALVGQPLNNQIYYAANDDRYFSAGATSWTLMGGTYPSRGEAATAVLGKRIYYVGGRGSLTSVQAYDTTANAWITTGIADAPIGVDQGCAGAFGGVVYAFSSRTNGMLAYTESTNKWTTLAVTPPTCYMLNLPVWRSKLVMADNQFVRVFNPTTQVWETPIPLPALASSSGWVTAVAGTAGDLYVLGWAGGSTYIYKWVLN